MYSKAAFREVKGNFLCIIIFVKSLSTAWPFLAIFKYFFRLKLTAELVLSGLIMELKSFANKVLFGLGKSLENFAVNPAMDNSIRVLLSFLPPAPTMDQIHSTSLDVYS